MMQIKKVVLYNYSSEKRELCFELGALNIITGVSGTGKTALGTIIDYILGSSEGVFPDGPIRDTVAWSALVLECSGKELFVARKSPDEGCGSSDLYYILEGKTLDIPNSANQIVSNSSTGDAKGIMSKELGIERFAQFESKKGEYSQITIREATPYCFQKQDEIASQGFLFHGCARPMLQEYLKKTFPYFAGAITSSYVELSLDREELRNDRAELVRKNAGALQARTSSRRLATELVAAAFDSGMLEEFQSKRDYSSDLFLESALRAVSDWRPEEARNGDIGSELGKARDEYASIKSKIEDIDFQIHGLQEYSSDEEGYATELSYQKSRLHSIGLYSDDASNRQYCPLCGAPIETYSEAALAVRDNINDLNRKLDWSQSSRARAAVKMEELKNRRAEEKEKLRAVEAKIRSIVRERDEYEKTQDYNAVCSRIAGRASLLVEQVYDNLDKIDYSDRINTLSKKIERLDSEIDEIRPEDKMAAFLASVQADMSKWAEELKLEHAGNPFRLDAKKMTIIVEKEGRGITLPQIGSGFNWICMHLLVYFALQKMYVKLRRPVPSFIFLDQPSQVNSGGADKLDREQIVRLYNFIQDRVAELNGGLQVIIVDHADDSAYGFADYVVEDWRDGEALVPATWIV